MKIKTAILAAVMSVGIAAGASAQEKVTDGTFDGNLNNWTFGSVANKNTSRTNDFGVVDTGRAGLLNAPNALFQILSLEVGRYTFSFTGLFNGNSGSSLIASIGNLRVGQVILETFTGNNIAGAKSFEFDVARAGNYTMLFLGNALGANSRIAVDNVSVKPVVAVPGPEAGAGLAGLAMAGMYVWASRRRKAHAAA